jgi:hypothetical protein
VTEKTQIIQKARKNEKKREKTRFQEKKLGFYGVNDFNDAVLTFPDFDFL